MNGIIRNLEPQIRQNRLHVTAELETETGERVVAGIPQREIAAMLPRRELIGTATRTTTDVLEDVRRILSDRAQDRPVRYWTYRDRNYCSFLSWRDIRIIDDDPVHDGPDESSEAVAPPLQGYSDGHGDVEGGLPSEKRDAHQPEPAVGTSA